MDLGGLILGMGMIGLAFIAVGLGLTRRGAEPPKLLVRVITIVVGLLLLGGSYYLYGQEQTPPDASFELRETPAPEN